MNNIRVGVDHAKEVIQVFDVKVNNVTSNHEMPPNELPLLLITIKSTIIIFEACGTSNYWKQKALEAGHNARSISAQLVASIRQKQKMIPTIRWR